MEKYVICLIIYDLFILWFHPLISRSSDSIPGRIPPLVEKYRKLAERKCPHRWNFPILWDYRKKFKLSLKSRTHKSVKEKRGFSQLRSGTHENDEEPGTCSQNPLFLCLVGQNRFLSRSVQQEKLIFSIN